MKLAIAIPTRGAILTETLEAIQTNIYVAQQHYVLDTPPVWFTTHNKPIPDGHLHCLEQALNWDCDAVWFVEEDVIPPSTALLRLVEALQAGADLAFVDYPMPGATPGYPACYHRNPRGQVTWTGFGCTLIHRRAFDMIDKPWFRVDQVAEWVKKDTPEETIRWREGKAVYGGFDIWFGWQLFQAGGLLEVVPGITCRHVRLAALGQREIQNGLHVLEEVSKASTTQ